MAAANSTPRSSGVERVAGTAESLLDTFIPRRLGVAGDVIKRYPLLSGAIAYLAVGAVTAYFIRAASCSSRTE